MTRNEKQRMSDVNSSELRNASAPLIFISHDSRDAKLAEMFSKLLSSVSAGVLKSFRSSDNKGSQGIEYGVEWYPVLMKNLDAASDVVCLLTRRSLERPWILYEAGVAKGKLNTPVHGVALGIPLSLANTGPFAQFQNSDDKEDSLTKLVIQLVSRIHNADPDRDVIQMQVRSFKDGIEKVFLEMNDATESKDESAVAEAPVVKLFEEVKLMFQDLPSRLASRFDRPDRSRFWRRFHPMMLFELTDLLSSNSRDPIGLLVIAAMFRDDVPWLYEIGMDAYRAAQSDDPAVVEQAFRRFQRAVEILSHGPFLEETATSKEVHMLLRELPEVIERFRITFQFRSGKAEKAQSAKKGSS